MLEKKNKITDCNDNFRKAIKLLVLRLLIKLCLAKQLSKFQQALCSLSKWKPRSKNYFKKVESIPVPEINLTRAKVWLSILRFRTWLRFTVEMLSATKGFKLPGFLRNFLFAVQNTYFPSKPHPIILQERQRHSAVTPYALPKLSTRWQGCRKFPHPRTASESSWSRFEFPACRHASTNLSSNES